VKELSVDLRMDGRLLRFRDEVRAWLSRLLVDEALRESVD